MKKILAGTTALVAAAVVAGQAQAADPIKLSLGGFMQQYVGYTDNEDDAGAANFSEIGTWSNAEVYFRGSTKLDNGLTVSVTMDMETSGGTDGNTDDTFLAISSDSLGTVRIGSTKGASYGLSNGGSVDGLGLNDGDASAFANVAVLDNAQTFDLDTLTSSADGHKVVYLTPNLGGFQAGVSYGLVPEANAGSADTTQAGNDIQYNAGIAYSGDFGGVSVAADVNYEQIEDGGNAATAGTADNEESIRYGLSVGVAGFTIGGSYIDIDNLDNVGKRDASRWEVAVGYETGPYSVSAGYLSAKQDDNTTVAGATTALEDEADMWVIGGSYDLGAGVSVAGNIFSIETDDASVNTANSQNEGDNWGVAAGMLVSF